MLRRPRCSVAGARVTLQSGRLVHTHIRDAESANARQRSNSASSALQNRGSTNVKESNGAWAERVQRELLSDFDPLLGRFHPDFYRDPSAGYVPSFAPRNFANGGAFEHPHHQSQNVYSQSSKDRGVQQHEYEQDRSESQVGRRRIREGGDVLSSHSGKSAEQQQTGTAVVGGSIVDVLLDTLTAESHHHKTGGDRRSARAISGDSFHAGLDLNDIAAQTQRAVEIQNDRILEESLRAEHGLRAKERFDFDVKQRSEYLKFRGYDMDRHLAAKQSAIQGMNPFTQIGNVVAPGSLTEAHENVRRNAVADRDSQISQSLHNNTVRADPKLGESLVEDISERLRSATQEKVRVEERERKEKFGLGRQGPLVQDGGPDKRTQKRHANDERLMRALVFRSNAHRKTSIDEHADPHARNDVSQFMGVQHLLRNKFDMDRRAAARANGEADITERATQYHGKQVQEEIDHFVLRRRNARGERPLEYFTPFPTYRDFRLQGAYRDLEGFPIMRARPEFLEWELFTRYRAHFEQRRELALRHGLEPRANETVSERNARRAALDQICEQTPFDASRFAQTALGELSVDAAALRAWFGFYLLPSPTIVEGVVSGDSALCLVTPTDFLSMAKADAIGTSDHREHVLSSRYLNKLFLDESYRHRLGRGSVKDLLDRAPDASAPHKQRDEVLKSFSKEERAVYQRYLAQYGEEHLKNWEKHFSGRRWVSQKGQYGECVRTPDPISVFDVERVHDGAIITIAENNFKELIAKAMQDVNRTIDVEKEECRLLEHSKRVVSILAVRLDDGTELPMDAKDFYSGEPEHQVSDVNFAINAGVGKKYHYNRSNYVETQDAIWEENCGSRSEGWSPATHADGLRVGLPVLARRVIDKATGRQGELQRGVIAQYLKQPFYNPEPRTVTVSFAPSSSSSASSSSKDHLEQVPLADLLIWQRQYYGPERTVGEKSRKLNFQSRRYINAADPTGLRDGKNNASESGVHFLDKYKVHSAQATADALQSQKEVSEIDTWSRKHDSPRSENFRPLSINDRQDYVRQGYFHRYTPWDWIATQEADQPLLWHQLRTDDIGPSYHHSPNRYWRFKARPHGYIRNFENEVRDLFQYVDGITPWEKAKKIRTYWEVREHHPMPQFNRPQVAIHRNQMGLLPAQMWDTDKKTGRVKSVKDSVRDYQTVSPVPSWGM
ncbi:Hypothetical protein, putative [Bodo saltans]|uniref:Uncharacterized protein n=1 Tax=Bodo saltans TaxID=75058 RepID=A0A0S4JLH0_BODSA|nr:Hypothetical protein, putative [Bodo saltans]|eukprot:CUG92362.1 Hypothetical protein, putative [Bodo saltans]